MNSSNGTSYITEIEAKLGDLMRDSFPHDGTYEDYHKAKSKFLTWIETNRIRLMSFWDYIKQRNNRNKPCPQPVLNSKQGRPLRVFDDELATRGVGAGISS
jgi:hypothetical protein